MPSRRTCIWLQDYPHLILGTTQQLDFSFVPDVRECVCALALMVRTPPIRLVSETDVYDTGPRSVP